MSATFTFNGIEIHVPTSELGEALRQLGAVASTPTPTTASPPPVQLPVSRQWVVEPAASAAQAHNKDLAPRERLPRQGLRANVVGRERQVVGRLLSLLLRSRQQGAISQEVMTALETSGSRGLSSMTDMLNAQLAEAGFLAEDVYRKARTHVGRVWLPGPKIDDAAKAFGATTGVTTSAG